MNKFGDWEIRSDLGPNDLNLIQKVSDKAFALVAQHTERLKNKEGALSVIGFLHALEGLDYHLNCFEKNSIGVKRSKNRMHDIVAYLNRLGQLYYTINSKFIISKIGKDEIKKSHPKIKELKELRMKNTAHRSIDYPKNEPEDTKRIQSVSLLGFDLFVRDGKEYFAFPLQKGEQGHYVIEFHPIDDHLIIMNEAYEILEKLIESILKS